MDEGPALPPSPAHLAGNGHLLVGPSNSAGQGAAWAGAVGQHLDGWTAHCLYIPTSRSRLLFEGDTVVDMAEWFDVGVRRRLAVEVVGPSTHVLVETLRPIVGTGSPASDPTAHVESAGYRAADVHALLASGRRVGVLLHGSEVRLPALHADLDAWSPFRGRAGEPYVTTLQRRAEMTLEALAQLDTPVFVSTLDLLDYVPTARWLPVVVPTAGPSRTGTTWGAGGPVVAHLPSNPFLKGSDQIQPVIARLDDVGVVRSSTPGRLAPSQVGDYLRSVDVLVDQVVLGNPGVLAAQAMAAGCLVVAHVRESVRRRFPLPPPIVEATAETLEGVLEDVARRPEVYTAVAARGPDFVRRLHDGRLSARVLHESLLTDSPLSRGGAEVAPC